MEWLGQFKSLFYAMALPNNAIAGAASAYVTYLDRYQDPRTDGCNGDYAAIMNEYAAPLVDAVPPTTIAARVTASAHDIPHVYAMLNNTTNGLRIVYVHRVAPYDIGMGMNDNEWTGRVFFLLSATSTALP
jgi:hypothetical protein